jgi:PPK2 family polyphosphate:nucleotide phosphotransferase
VTFTQRDAIPNTRGESGGAARDLESPAVIEELRVEPGQRANLTARDTRGDFGLGKQEGKERLSKLVERLGSLQHRLYAEGKRSLLLVLQGLDASGKDGVIRSVFTGVNPLGCRAVSFKAPTPTELAHDFLWRIHAALPERGQIGIFNRSHYEDIVTVRVLGLAPETIWKRRPRDVNNFERMLVDEGTTIVKVFLNVSKEEQATRLQERLSDPEKRWKFRKTDLESRKRWDNYTRAYDEAITATSKRWAPWYVVPADRNWVKNLAVATLLDDALERIDPKLPDPEPGIENIMIV